MVSEKERYTGLDLNQGRRPIHILGLCPDNIHIPTLRHSVSSLNARPPESGASLRASRRQAE